MQPHFVCAFQLDDHPEGFDVSSHSQYKVALLQPENALLPTLVTELGMVMDVKPPQFWNAELPMLVTELGMVYDVSGLLAG